MDYSNISIERHATYEWHIAPTGPMRVGVRIYGDEETVRELKKEIARADSWSSLRQLLNVAALPGVIDPVIAMADVHPGYGFPIGGIGAFDGTNGIISVAGVGFDCNCGVRMIRVPLTKRDILNNQEPLAQALFRDIPAGIGSKGQVRLTVKELDRVLEDGVGYCIAHGMGLSDDAAFIEERGAVSGARPAAVSARAKERQLKQVGTLGSGNHYLEVQYVDAIFDEEAARCFGLMRDHIVVSIHCGSRALGHQIGTDYLSILERATKKYGITIPDKELVCAPIASDEAQEYMGAIACAVNCAFANRQVLAHLTRTVFSNLFSLSPEDMTTLYDVGHNNAKREEHQGKKVLVHRKGSTRALGPGHPLLPERYKKTGQPVLVGGTMGTASYVLSGTEKGMRDAYGSSIHGAGRRLSRKAAKKECRGHDVVAGLRKNGIIIKSSSLAGVAEEAPRAYKNVDEVVAVVHEAGISRKVARLRPLVCIKG